MNRRPHELALVLISMVCILVLAACNCAPVLTYLVITPATQTIAVGTTQQFTATGYYSNGSITPNLAVSWGSSSSTVATINSSGIATALAIGTTSITATTLGITAAPATLTVNQLTAITVTPANPSVAAGNTEQFTATGTFLNPGGTTTTSNITAQVNWNSGTTTVATISTGGLATSIVSGTSLISASLDGITGSTTLTVTGAVPVSLVITPATPTIAVGNSVAFSAQELWSDSTLHAPSGPVSWGSATTTVAAIQTTGGEASGITAGSSVITATEGSLSGTATLTVVAGSTHFGYVSNNTDATIQWYTVTASASPYLTSQGTLAQTSGVGSTQTVIHPSGAYMYYTDSNANLWVTTINSSTGAPTLSSAPSHVIGTSGDTYFTVIDPYGRFLYTSDDGGGVGGTITGFTINQTDGSLTPITLSPSPFTTNLNTPECLIIDPTGTYLYALNDLGNNISAYTINQSSGALTPLSTPTFNTGAGPYLGALDPSGTHLYTANSSTLTVSSFSIGTGGVLTSLGADTPVTGATYLANLVVDPSGTHIYVLDQGNTSSSTPTNGQVFGFNIGTGGVIGSAISGTPVATGLGPFAGIVIDRSGTLLGVENNLSNNISLFTIGSGGALTSQTPVNTGNGPFYLTFLNAP
jgi:trimeric autotransporter adhesin